MKNSISLLLIAFVLLFTFQSCNKDKKSDFDPNEKGKLVLHFDNRAGAADLVLNTTTYTNALGQDFNISLFQYYISNIVLLNSDGSKYTVPQNNSYFLIKESNAATAEVVLNDIPEGNYSGVSFVIGVDSTRNTLPVGDRTGVLDPTAGGQGMYWSWNSGYIFVKMEGNYDSASVQRPYKYHIGGFGGYSSVTINNIKTATLSFGSKNAEVRKAKTAGPEVHFYVDALKVLNGTTNVDFMTNPVVMFSPYSVNISKNYEGMITVDHVHND